MARLFTIDEANALIPRLERIITRMQRFSAELRAAINTAAQNSGSASVADVEQWLNSRPDLRRLVTDLERCLAEIEECGGQFKGLDLGLVDFPGAIDGQIGLLCWQYGERAITHWHPLDEGFASRRPLPDCARPTVH